MSSQPFRKRWLLLGIMPLLMVAIGLGTVFAATLINGSFEDATINGWTGDTSSGGSITVETAADGNVAADGTYFARFTNDGLNTFTTLSQDVTVGAGETISGFAYFFEPANNCLLRNDIAQVTVGGAVAFYASSCTTSGVHWTPWSATFNVAGTYTIEARISSEVRSSGGGGVEPDAYMGLDGSTFLQAVGGVTTFSTGSDSSSGSKDLVAGGAAAFVAIAIVAGWYARRRWRGSRTKAT